MIASFEGEYRFLSNFYASEIRFSRIVFPTVEHAYQAAKSQNPEDWFRIAELSSAGAAKRAGQKLTLRPDWDAFKVPAMEELLQKKFAHTHLAEMLKATGSQELVEGNYWGDTFWGVCRGKGENHLGKLLMKIRSTL